MNQGSSIRDLVWTSLLSADLNRRYFGELGEKFRTRDRVAKVFLAVTSSATVSGWAIWGTPELSWIWHATSGLAAVVGLALPIFDPASTVRIASQLSGAWFSLLKDYEILWTQTGELDESACRERFQGIVAEEKRLVELEATLQKDRALARRCENEVRTSRGLD